MNIQSIDSARELLNSHPEHNFGMVLSKSKQGYLIKLESGSTLLANKAFSCPFLPENNDYVSIMRSGQKGYFITNILERSGTLPARMETESELHICSQQSVKVQSNSIALSSLEYTSSCQTHTQSSEKLDVSAKYTSFQSETVESNMTRLVQRIKDSFKMIERIEQVNAKDIIQNIKNNFIQRSKQVDITAKSDVKINGDRIHMG